VYTPSSGAVNAHQCSGAACPTEFVPVFVFPSASWEHATTPPFPVAVTAGSVGGAGVGASDCGDGAAVVGAADGPGHKAVSLKLPARDENPSTTTQ